jgi:hypothetical protein
MVLFTGCSIQMSIGMTWHQRHTATSSHKNADVAVNFEPINQKK